MRVKARVKVRVSVPVEVWVRDHARAEVQVQVEQLTDGRGAAREHPPARGGSGGGGGLADVEYRGEQRVYEADWRVALHEHKQPAVGLLDGRDSTHLRGK